MTTVKSVLTKKSQVSLADEIPQCYSAVQSERIMAYQRRDQLSLSLLGLLIVISDTVVREREHIVTIFGFRNAILY